MLPKRNRIPRAEFKAILGSRRFAHSTHFSLRVAPAAGTPRAAVSVSKKVSKSAVVRNGVRRRAYAVLESELGGLSSGLYLFSAKPGAQKLRGTELAGELRSLLKQA